MLYDFAGGNSEKVEHVVGHIEYNVSKVFVTTSHIDYEDNYAKFKGKLFSVKLYDFNSSEDIVKKVVNPLRWRV